MNITPFITNGGMAHLNRIAVLGQPLTITSARLGAGRLSFTSEAERELLSVERSSLVDERASARVARCELREGIYSIVVQVESADIQEELYVWELGLYVEGESGEDVLFCYVSFSDAPDWIPPGSVAQYVRDYEIGIALSTENAAMTVSPAALVRTEHFDAHLNDRGNPHRVEPAQIGALPIGFKIGNAVIDGTNKTLQDLGIYRIRLSVSFPEVPTGVYVDVPIEYGLTLPSLPVYIGVRFMYAHGLRYNGEVLTSTLTGGVLTLRNLTTATVGPVSQVVELLIFIM